jgi:hypothetical protein
MICFLGGPHKEPLFTQPYPIKDQDFNHINKHRIVLDLCNNKIHIYKQLKERNNSSCWMIELLFHILLIIYDSSQKILLNYGNAV